MKQNRQQIIINVSLSALWAFIASMAYFLYAYWSAIAALGICIFYLFGFPVFTIARKHTMAVLEKLKPSNYFYVPLTKTLFFWSLSGCLLFLFLQMFPITGIFLVFLMAILGPSIFIVIPQLPIFALLADVAAKRASKLLLIFPLIVYGSYYYSFIQNELTISDTERYLASQNPTQVLEFNSEETSLIIPYAESYVQRYKIPVAYESNSNMTTNYTSYRIVPQKYCAELRDSKFFEENPYSSFSMCTPVRYKVGAERADLDIESLSIFRHTDKPEHKILKITDTGPEYSTNKTGLSKRFAGINFELSGFLPPPPSIGTYTFFLDGVEIAKYKYAIYSKLGPLPLFLFGCALSDSPSAWVCLFQPVTYTYYINTVNPKNKALDSIGELLGLKPYTEGDLLNLQEYPENKAAMENLTQEWLTRTANDYNEYGLWKNSPYFPQIDEKDGIPRYIGKIGGTYEAAAFRSFISSHQGQKVYFDIYSNNGNDRENSISIYGACKKGVDCGRVDNTYIFVSSDGSKFIPTEQGHYKGFWLIGNETIWNDDADTNVTLTSHPN